MKKEYVLPELLFQKVTIRDVLTGSVEGYSQYIDDGGDWGDIDDDDLDLIP